ncbi:MAG: OmpA family protein [Polyangiaceae bacterium]|nr:OmpA family protein [Polyangiaceae bacterium]
MSDKAGPSGLGKILSLLLITALIGLGLFVVLRKDSKPGPEPPAGSAAAPGSASAEPEAEEGGLVETKLEVPRLAPPGAYTPKDGTIDVELSEYAGYAGLIVANGGLAPSDASPIFKKHGVKLRIKLSEAETWGDLASGRLGVSATTTDVLAVYGQRLGAVVPAQIGFSRGADGVVVRSDVKRVNQLKGRVLVTSQFNEADFLIRFLAQEAGLGVKLLENRASTPDPDKVNLLFAGDAEQAGQVFLRDVQSGGTLAGCVTWAPFTNEVVEKSAGKAHILVTNRNLLVVADVLVVNKAFAEQSPKMVFALVDALLEGNRMVRADPGPHLDTIAKAFGWKREDVPKELAKVHLSNLPESLAFFSGAIDAAGSFGGIYQSALLAYGAELIKNPAPEDKLLDLSHLQALEKSGAYKDQKVEIAPIKGGGDRTLEADPLLSKDIRFFFEPNSSKLDLAGEAKAPNEKSLAAIKNLLQLSPGSTVLLRGHVDDAMIAEFRKLGGDQLVQKKALEAAQLSTDRAAEIRRLLVEKQKIDAKRIDIFGVGWNEPASKTDPDLNRRVEVHWFTLE